jgi:hypothetical protein
MHQTYTRLSSCPVRRATWAIPAGLALLLGAGCAEMTTSTKGAEPYSNQELLQSTHNRYANLAMRDNLDNLRQIQLDLYQLNPQEAAKGGISPSEAVERVWNAVRSGAELPDLGGKRDVPAINLALDADYGGDRVAALTFGIATMLTSVYGGQVQLRMIDGLSADKLYRSARNIETGLRLLTERRLPGGGPLLLCAPRPGTTGPSIERDVGKIVGRLDLLAANMDEKYRRAAINYVQSLVMGQFLELIPVQ